VLLSLAELGMPFRTVEQSIHDADVTVGQVDRLDVGRRFVTVVLGSHLVNTPDEGLRRAWLRAAARHLAGDGDVLVEHHPLDWAETAAPTAPSPGADVGMADVRSHPPFVSATSVYEIGGREFRQPFTARVLTDAELAAALAGAGLEVRRRLGSTWIEAARPMEDPTRPERGPRTRP
jgi:hypothetical protein